MTLPSSFHFLGNEFVETNSTIAHEKENTKYYNCCKIYIWEKFYFYIVNTEPYNVFSIRTETVNLNTKSIISQKMPYWEIYSSTFSYTQYSIITDFSLIEEIAFKFINRYYQGDCIDSLLFKYRILT